MAEHSSTSRSSIDDPVDETLHSSARQMRGKPWALIGAIGIILALELLIRATGWPKRIPYELGLDEYYTAAAAIDRDGPAEVSIVGSSRTRESIHVPMLADSIERVLGREVRVANYSSSGARAIDFEAMVRRLLRDPNPPKVIVIGISERDLSRDPALYDQVPIFWDFADIRRVWSENRELAIAELPTVIRNEFGKYWSTLRYRTQIRLRIWHILHGEGEMNSPAGGDMTPWQRMSPTHTLRRQPVPPARVKKYVAGINFSRYPDETLVRSLEALARECKAANVQLVFYEMPIPKILREALPKAVYPRFLSAVNRVAIANDALFVRLRVLNIRWTDNDFRETSHMASLGAKKLSKALAIRVIAPVMQGKLKPRSQPATQLATQPPATRSVP